VRSRREAQQLDCHASKPTDFLQFMMDAANEHDGRPDKLAHRQLILSLGSIHVTSVSLCQIWFELVSRPKYVPELREELESVLEACGDWSKEALGRLTKLDSFMQEALRLNPPSIRRYPTSHQRRG
jgi:cytochrome P450